MPVSIKKKKTVERLFTLEEYMDEYASRPFDESGEDARDDPDAVGTELANQSVEILRTALGHK